MLVCVRCRTCGTKWESFVVAISAHTKGYSWNLSLGRDMVDILTNRVLSGNSRKYIKLP